jgi:DNA-directed RNA polymerase sigma subunit (sigma70/sigma32)
MPDTMTQPKKPAARDAEKSKKVNRSGSALNTQIDEDVRDQLDAYIEDHNAKNEHHATIRSTLEAALKLYLKAKGFWPPPSDA